MKSKRLLLVYSLILLMYWWKDHNKRSNLKPLSLWNASCINPRPHFFNCMQNDVMSAPQFPQKNNHILLNVYWCFHTANSTCLFAFFKICFNWFHFQSNFLWLEPCWYWLNFLHKTWMVLQKLGEINSKH